MARKKGLTALQRAFVGEYLKDKIGSKAAIRAGVPPSAARQTASDWLNRPEYQAVQDAINIALSDVLSDGKALRRQVFTSLCQMGFGVLPIDEIEAATREGKRLSEVLDPAEIGLIQSVSVSRFQDEGTTVRVKGYSRLAALQALMKHFGGEDGLEQEDDQADQLLGLKLDAIERRLLADCSAELADLGLDEDGFSLDAPEPATPPENGGSTPCPTMPPSPRPPRA